jgi:hypothetical protein
VLLVLAVVGVCVRLCESVCVGGGGGMSAVSAVLVAVVAFVAVVGDVVVDPSWCFCCCCCSHRCGTKWRSRLVPRWTGMTHSTRTA